MLDITKVSDRLPPELINPRKHWNLTNPAHVMNVVILQPAVWHEYIPRTHRDKICFSMGKEGHNEPTKSRGGLPCCGGCGKPYPWFSHFCVGCGEFFIRDFFSPQFCSLYPTCWDCLPELPWSYCPAHGDNELRFREVMPPAGLNPRKYTQEELDDVFGPGFFD